MMINLDKRVFEIAKELGYKITYNQFLKVYRVRMEERFNDPKAVVKRERQSKIDKAELEAYRVDFKAEREADFKAESEANHKDFCVIRNFTDGLFGAMFLQQSVDGRLGWNCLTTKGDSSFDSLVCFNNEKDAEAWIISNLNLLVTGGKVGDGYPFMFKN